MRLRPSAARCLTASAAPPLSSGSRHKRVGAFDLRVNIDDRQAARDRLDRLAPVGAARGDDEAVDALAEQLLDVPPLAHGSSVALHMKTAMP